MQGYRSGHNGGTSENQFGELFLRSEPPKARSEASRVFEAKLGDYATVEGTRAEL